MQLWLAVSSRLEQLNKASPGPICLQVFIKQLLHKDSDETDTFQNNFWTTFVLTTPFEPCE